MPHGVLVGEQVIHAVRQRLLVHVRDAVWLLLVIVDGWMDLSHEHCIVQFIFNSNRELYAGLMQDITV